MILGEVLLRHNNANPSNNHDDRDTISSAQRNSYRDWDSETRPGTGDLRIPRLRKDRQIPPVFLEPRRTAERRSPRSSRKQWREVADQVSLHVPKFAMPMNDVAANAARALGREDSNIRFTESKAGKVDRIFLEIFASCRGCVTSAVPICSQGLNRAWPTNPPFRNPIRRLSRNPCCTRLHMLR